MEYLPTHLINEPSAPFGLAVSDGLSHRAFVGMGSSLEVSRPNSCPFVFYFSFVFAFMFGLFFLGLPLAGFIDRDGGSGFSRLVFGGP